jgi:glycosyltransferase involved in cell wall biosynthesis
MIIGVDVREWEPGRRTGIGRFLEELLRAGSALRPGDRFLLLANSATEIRVSGPNIEAIRTPRRWTPWLDQVTFPRLLARRHGDVFYSPYIKAPVLASMPVVNTIHDLIFLLDLDGAPGPRRRLSQAVFRAFCRLVTRRACATIVDSETSARDVRRLLGPGVGRLHVVPLGASSAFRPEGDPHGDAMVRRRYGLGEGYVLFVGGFLPHKNVPRLVRAHASLPQPLRSRHPLVLVGGPLSVEIGDLMREEKIAQGTRHLGVVPDADLPAIYRGARLFAFPSRYEGFGLPLLEAMACGIPVLCSSAPALVELTQEAAPHLDPESEEEWEQTLAALLQDRARRDMLSSQGLARAASYSADRMIRAILGVLEEAAALGGKGRT